MDIILDNNAFEQEIDNSVNFDQKKRRKSSTARVNAAKRKVRSLSKRLTAAKKQVRKAKASARRMRKRC